MSLGSAEKKRIVDFEGVYTEIKQLSRTVREFWGLTNFTYLVSQERGADLVTIITKKGDLPGMEARTIIVNSSIVTASPYLAKFPITGPDHELNIPAIANLELGISYIKLLWMLKFESAIHDLNIPNMSLTRLFEGILHIMTVAETSHDIAGSHMFDVIFDDLLSTIKAYFGISFHHLLDVVAAAPVRVHRKIGADILLAHIFREKPNIQLSLVIQDFHLLQLPIPGLLTNPADFLPKDWLQPLHTLLHALKPSDDLLRECRTAAIHLALMAELGFFDANEYFKIVLAIVQGKFIFFSALRHRLICVCEKTLTEAKLKRLTVAFELAPEETMLSREAMLELLEKEREKLLDISRRLGKNNIVLLAPIVPRP